MEVLCSFSGAKSLWRIYFEFNKNLRSKKRFIQWHHGYYRLWDQTCPGLCHCTVLLRSSFIPVSIVVGINGKTFDIFHYGQVMPTKRQAYDDENMYRKLTVKELNEFAGSDKVCFVIP